jgi:hypothetical protein
MSCHHNRELNPAQFWINRKKEGANKQKIQEERMSE